MRLSQSVGYAIAALAQLADHDGAKPLSCREICRRVDMPDKFVLQILRLLARANIVASTRGIQGGYRSAKPADKISLLEIVEAVDGLPQPDGETVLGLSASGQRTLDAALAGVDADVRNRLGTLTLDMMKAAKP
jgi:Rrf2 family protein